MTIKNNTATCTIHRYNNDIDLQPLWAKENLSKGVYYVLFE